MAGATVTVDGGDELARTLKVCRDDLENMGAAHSTAAGIVAGAAVSRAPRRSGRLASSVSVSTSDGAVVEFSAPYAGPIHWGWEARGIGETRFAVDAARSTEPSWFAVYEDAVQKALSKVRGT